MSDGFISPFKPIKKVRSKPRPGRVRGKAMGAMRSEVFKRDGDCCTNCGAFVPKTGHLAHKRSKRMFGDSPENTCVECPKCHGEYHAYGPSRQKPCPVRPVIKEIE